MTRAARRALPVAVMLVALALGGWWYGSHSAVTLNVDGEVVSVRTRAGTVSELLRERGVSLAAHDRVRPPLESAIGDDLEIRVARARPIAIDLNGAMRAVWTTGETVTDVLRELGLDADVVEPARSAPLRRGTTVVLRNAHEVSVVADGDEVALLTSALTVEELLEDAGVVLGPDDEVSPGLDAEVDDGLVVEVTRIDQTLAVEEHAIPFTTVRREDPSLPRGEVRTVQDGRSGIERIEYELTRRDGEVVSREVIGRTVIREPVTRIVAVGTKVTSRQSGIASWYSTASMTCAHRTLPFGTRVTVVNVANGRSVVCRVADRGPFVDGRVIDLAHDAFSQLEDPSVGLIEVRISW